jgi:hypothetical protein
MGTRAPRHTNRSTTHTLDRLGPTQLTPATRAAECALIEPDARLEHGRASRTGLRAGPTRAARKCGPAGPFYGPAGPCFGPAGPFYGPAVPCFGLGPAWADHETAWAAPRTCRRTNPMCSASSMSSANSANSVRSKIGACSANLGIIAAVIRVTIRTAGPRAFGRAGQCANRKLGGRDSELPCVCSRTGVSNGPGVSSCRGEPRER